MKLIRKTYVTRSLKRQLKQARKEFASHLDHEAFRQLLSVALGLFALAAVLYAIGGHHTGFHSMNQWSPYFPTGFWDMVTFIGDVNLSLCLMLFFARRNPAAIWIVFIAAILGLFVTHGMKDFFAIMRPPAVLEEGTYNLVGQAFRQGSFPSGHSFSVFLLISTLFYFANRGTTRAWLIAFGLTVATSRVMVAAHWPVDVLVGSGLGILTVLASVYLARRSLWALNIGMHSFVVLLHVIATISLFSHDGGYPAAQLFGQLVATTCLAFFISEYFVTPYAQARRRLSRIRV